MTVYRPYLSLGSGPQKYECIEAGEEAIILDVHPEPVQLQDGPKDQGEEPIVFNLVEEGK